MRVSPNDEGGSSEVIPSSENGEANAPVTMASSLRNFNSTQQRRGSFQARFDAVENMMIYEPVKLGELSKSLIKELTTEIQFYDKLCKEKNRDPTRKDYLAVLGICLASLVITPTLSFIPLGPVFPPVEDSFPWFWGVSWANATIILLGVSQFFVCLLNIPNPSFRVVIISAALSAVFIPVTVSIYLLFPGAVFPLPFTHLTAGVPACASVLAMTLFPYRAMLMKDANFRSSTLLALVVAVLNIVVAMLLVLYRSAFARSSIDQQSWFALLLPLIKFLTKNCGKLLTNRSSSADFVHGAGVFSEVVCSALSAVLFMSLKNPMTFVYLLAIDVIENLYHFALCLKFILASEIDMNLKQSAEIDRFLNDVHELAKEAKLSEREENESESLGGMKQRFSKIRDVYKTHKKNRSELVAFSMGSRRLLNPRVLHTCANLFMSEIVEVTVPAVVGICSAILWYQPNGIRKYISYMQEIDEERFKTGLKYIAIEFVAQLSTAFVVFEGLRKLTDVNCSTVGVFLIKKHLMYYTLVVPTAVIFFLTCFVEHWGNDATLQFEWLRDQGNSTSSADAGGEG